MRCGFQCGASYHNSPVRMSILPSRFTSATATPSERNRLSSTVFFQRMPVVSLLFSSAERRERIRRREAREAISPVCSLIYCPRGKGEFAIPVLRFNIWKQSMRSFKSLNEQEILALAISLEEEDARIYDDFADGLKASYPVQAEEFRRLRAEEDGHRHRLLDLYRKKFGEHIPLIRRQDVKGFVSRKPVWLVRPLGLDAVRKQAELMELETKRFYEKAAQRATDAGIRQLLGDLAEEERKHERLAESIITEEPDTEAAARKREFVLQVVQPGLAGLMDGSVSTLAPLFAAAFATHQNKETFLVGLAASLGAGISMGFAEALSDDGSLTGRGRAWVRGP